MLPPELDTAARRRAVRAAGVPGCSASTLNLGHSASLQGSGGAAVALGAARPTSTSGRIAGSAR